ncbi:CDP-alcohol phosphatidyltransferase family protein [Chloroflexota bacterium]
MNSGNIVVNLLTMSENGERILKLKEENLSFLQRNLADFLTLSRVIIGLIILSLSLLGKSAYLAVVILTLVGAVTDILDGKVARHYFGETREGKLGKHDVEVDTLFVLCVMGYFSFSGIVIHRAIGFGWIGLVLIATALSRRNLKVLIVSEVITVIALLITALLYFPLIFGVIIAPAMTGGIIVNRRRVLYLVFDYWPSMFSK